MSARARRLTAISLAATFVAACSTPAGPAPSSDLGAKAGGKPGPISITVADSQFPDKPSNRPLAEFERQVETRSGGTMTVTIVTRVEDGAPGSDAVVIDRVRSGAFEAAVVPARAWSAAGVTSLEALQSPFLFESDEHVAAVVDDPTLTGDLFSGLDSVGVTGLTLFPESLRHLFSFGEPMQTSADVKGKTIRAFGSSPETTALIEALGGTAVDPTDAEYQAAVDAGTIQGTDSGFTLATISPTNRAATATGNVALYAKVISLVINSALWTRLDDAQRTIITTASDATRAWAIANQSADAPAAAEFCAGGGRVVLANAAGIAAFRAAEAPVYAALESDPVTKRTIVAIKALAPVARGAAVEACEPVIDATTLVPDGGDLPDGIYRIEATEAYLKADYPDYVGTSEGIYTFTFRAGRWSFDYVAPGGGGDHQKGVYRVDGDDVYWLWDPCCSHPNPVLHLKWTVDERGILHFTLLSGPADWALALPFVRIGDLP